MILSTNQELRLHIPSNAVDDVSLLQGILDNSEKDFLKEKLGGPLYEKLCDYYNGIDPQEFYNSVVGGFYTGNPWAELLLNAQRMITNDALARFAFQQVISVNGAGINVVSGNDYGNADDRLLDKGVGGYKKEAAIACNNLLILLEEWSKQTTVSDFRLRDESNSSSGNSTPQEISEIVDLWKESNYFYLHSDLLIPTASVLQHYLDIYENRDKFIRLLPDLHFIQEEYIEEAFGEDFVKSLLSVSASGTSPSGASTPGAGTSPSGASAQCADEKLLRKVRRLIVAYLEQRTTVLTVDKVRRLHAHDESIALKNAILNSIKANASTSSEAVTSSVSEGYKNNQENSKIFVPPILY